MGKNRDIQMKYGGWKRFERTYLVINENENVNQMRVYLTEAVLFGIDRSANLN